MSDQTHPGAETPATDAQEATEAQDAPQAAPQSPEEQIADLRDKLLRAMAEAENTRRRAEKDKQEAAKFGMTKFARDLLSVADNMRRAIETIPAEERESVPEVARNLILGVEMIEKELLSTFEKYAIRKIDSAGVKFDPNRHQAVAEIPGTGQPDGSVVEVFQVGYVFEDRLLRPAMVTVAKGGPDQDASRQEPTGGMTGEAGGR